MLTIRHVHDGTVDLLTPADLPDALDATRGGAQGYVWVDLATPTAAEDAILDDPVLDLDPFVIEDIREDTHLPKLDLLPGSLLLTVHAIHVEESAIELSTVELDIVLRAGFVLTFRREPIGAVSATGRLVDEAPGTFDRAVLVVHRILDVMEDVFVPFLDHLGQRLDLVEEDVLHQPTVATRAEIFALRRDLITLRRISLAQAEVIRRVGRTAVDDIFAPGDRAYFRDVYDHLYRMAEVSEVYRQLVESAYDMYRSVREDETNRRLTVLTMVSTVLLPISVIAGVYGMNFVHMPELQKPWGYPAVLAAFALILVGGFSVFRAWGWVGRGADEEAQRRRNLVERLELPRLGRVLKVPAYGARFAVRSTKRVAGAGRRITPRRRRRARDEEREESEGSVGPRP